MFKRVAETSQSEDPEEGPSVITLETSEVKTIVPWIEKYRPKKVEDVVYQEEVVSVLKKCLTGSDFPNLLFYGPPGTGKTSTILALAREMFGEIYKNRVLELNASDERGIQVIREKVKNFSQQTASGVRPDGKPCPALKLVILDEADAMTSHAQAALRRTMEKESKSTRFCLICNYVTRIIEPITSRCAKFRFKSLSRDLIIGKLKSICGSEGVTLESDQVLEELVKVAEGDLRRAITLLHTCFRSKGSTGLPLHLLDLHRVSGHIPEAWLERLVLSCLSGSYAKLYTFVEDLIAEGFSATQFLVQLQEWVILHKDSSLSDAQKANVCEAIATADHCLLDGADESLQVLHVCVVLLQNMKTK